MSILSEGEEISVLLNALVLDTRQKPFQLTLAIWHELVCSSSCIALKLKCNTYQSDFLNLFCRPDVIANW